MATPTCSTFRCSKPSIQKKRKVVWTVNGKPYCNTCFLDWVERHGVGREKIVRLFDDEILYEDTRPKKRKHRGMTGAKNGNILNTPATHSVHG